MPVLFDYTDAHNDLKLNIRPEVRELAQRLFYHEANLGQWNRYDEAGLARFEQELLSLGLPTPLEAQLLGLHKWAMERQNCAFPGDIVAVFANVGFCTLQVPGTKDRHETSDNRPRIYYQPLSGRIKQHPCFDRHWGPVYRVEYDRAERVDVSAL